MVKFKNLEKYEQNKPKLSKWQKKNKEIKKKKKLMKQE